MTIIAITLAFVAGAWCEHGFDLSGRAVALWRRIEAWRRARK